MPRAQVSSAAQQLALPIENISAATPEADPVDAVKRSIIDRLYCEANMARRSDLYYVSGLGFSGHVLNPRLGSGEIRITGRGDGYHLTPRSRDVLAALVTLYLRQGKHQTQIGEYVPVETTLYELAVTAGIIENRQQWGTLVAVQVSNCIRDLWSSGVEIWHEWATVDDDSDTHNTKGRRRKKNTRITMSAFHFIDHYRMVLYVREENGKITTMGELKDGERGRIWLGLPIQDSVRRKLIVPLSRRVITLLSRDRGTVAAKNLYYYLQSNRPLDEIKNQARYELTIEKAAVMMGIFANDSRNKHRVPKQIVAAVRLLDEALRVAGEGKCHGDLVPTRDGGKKLVITLENQ